MADEIAKQPTWEERQRAATEQIRELMAGHTPESYLEAASNSEAEVNERHELQSWYTEAFDAAVLTMDYVTDRALESAARTAVRTAEPEKFARLRELERLQDLSNVRHQHLASGAQASIVEENLRSKHLYA